MDTRLTPAQISAAAADLGVDTAALQAVIAVECTGRGFTADGKPTILFERHVFRQRLIENGHASIAKQAMRERPDLCNTTVGGYGLTESQHGRLDSAARYDRISALEAASWGVGQIMGYHWRDLGYPSLQTFINAMYRDESSQLDAMCRFIRKNNLVDALKRHDWAGFAYRYNGAGYKTNQYDSKLATAYQRFKSNL